jgi:large repetitive protein
MAGIRSRRDLVSGVVIAVVLAVPVTLAIVHPGFPVTDVELTARDVWVTNDSTLQAGRLNRQINELNGSVTIPSTSFDVLQNGDDVFVVDAAAKTVSRVDPSFATLVQTMSVPEDAHVAYGGDVIGILAESTGSVWITDASGALSFDQASAPPLLELGSRGQIVVTLAGTVIAVSPQSETITRITADGSRTETAFTAPSSFMLSAVGEHSVVLDLDGDRLFVDGGAGVDLPTPGVRIQQPGPDSADALVASATSLLRVPLAGGEIVEIDAEVSGAASGDDVSAPVLVAGCAHGAWSSSSARYVVDCANGDSAVREIPGISAAARLEFRVNRDVVVLNNTATGDVFLLDDDMTVVRNWESVTPPQESEEESGEAKSTQLTFRQVLEQRTDQNRPPVANDDVFGARPGRSTLLPVIANDSDEDGDVLTIVSTTDVPESSGRLELIDGGRSLQFTSAEGATGGVSFRYTISDGRTGGVAEANVTVQIRQPDDHAAPTALRSSTVFVEVGQTITYNVLGDWTDPDGDDLVLQSATVTTADVVRTSPSGDLTFQSTSTDLGEKTVEFTVGDDRDSTVGILTVVVQEPGTLEPVGMPDFARGFPGEPVVISPLDNDLSPSGLPLGLVGATSLGEGGQFTTNPDRATIEFTAGQPGSYYLAYDLSAGAVASVGLIRVDVIEPGADEVPPVAVKDVVYLRGNEPASVSVLANDVSPSGRVLAVQSVSTPPAASGLTVEVLGNTVVRVSSATALVEQLQFTYTVSDGVSNQTSSATVTVVPLPLLTKNRAPVAVNDTARVRAGDIVSASVLDNDRHPDDISMSLQPELTSVPTDGVAFVTGDQVRFQAPLEPGVYTAGYSVVDANGETATAQVAFTVTALDLEANEAPTPAPLTSRVFAGSEVAVRVPLQGIDAEGDSVRLLGVSGGELGAVLGFTTDSFVYEAFSDRTGTDTLVYEVVDALGATAIGVVKIGVIPRGAVSMLPTATDDTVAIRPGRISTVSVLGNDSDPNGFDISILEDSLVIPDGIGASVVDNRVELEAGEVEGSFTISYTLSNGHSEDVASIFVTVSADAPLQYPFAADHSIERADLAGADHYDLDARDGAENPSGRVSDLAVELIGPNADAAEVLDDGTVRVTPRATRMAIAYRLINEVDQLGAMAFIIVPAAPGDRFDDPPQFREDLELPVKLDRDARGEWDLDDLLTVPSGRPAILTSADNVFATRSNGESSYLDDDTLQFTPEEGYLGVATIRFEVTDGDSGDDEQGNRTYLTLKIQVGDPDGLDVAPTFTPPSLGVEIDGQTTFDLRTATAHSNPDVIAATSFSNLSVDNAQLTVSLNGSELTVAAPPSMKPGTTATVSFELRYDRFTIPGTASIAVVSSTKPLAQAVEDHVYIERGAAVTVSPLLNDVNPTPKSALTIVSASAVNTNSGAAVSATTSTIGVSTNPSFIGDIEIQYTIADQYVEDTTRHVTGRVIVTVWDAPDQPAAPTILSSGDATVTIMFSPPVATNGSTVTGYTVRSSPASTPPSCTAGAPCTFSGLTNGQAYLFSVTALGEVPGTQIATTSEESAPSPSRKPFGTPAAPASAFATGSSAAPNGAVSMSWAQVTGSNTGGGSVRYMWEVFTSGGASQGSGTTTLSFASLSGRAAGNYYFTVRACNEGADGSWLNCSAPVASNTVAVTDPPASATVSQGALEPTSNGTCDPNECKHLVLNTTNFPAGTYSVSCYQDGINYYTQSNVAVLANGSVQLYCMSAKGHNVRLEVIGQYTTTDVYFNW